MQRNDSHKINGPGAFAVREFFTGIATRYDLVNRLFSLGLDASWRRRLAEGAFDGEPEAGAVILDLAAGTLEVSKALTRRWPGADVLAADFCLPMLEKGRAKLRPETRIFPLLADGHHLPLAAASVDAVTLAWGLRNMPPREAVYAEILRVLKPGGRLSVLEFAATDKLILFGLYNLCINHLLPLGGKLLVRNREAYEHLARSVAEYPNAEELVREMRWAGFCHVKWNALGAGICTLHVGKKG